MSLYINLHEHEIKKLTEEMRPPVDIRQLLDIGYSFEKQVLELFEIRPLFNNKSIFHQYPFARARFNKSTGTWKIYWMRASGKWVPYDEAPEVRHVSAFFKIVNEDEYHVFKG